MIRNPFNAATSAWREASELIYISTRQLWVLSALGAAVGLAETVFLAILASVGVALAGNTDVKIKLPIGTIDSPPMPLLLGLGAVAVLLTFCAHFLIVVGMARINSRVNATLRQEMYRDFVNTGWSVQRNEVEGAFISYIVNFIPRVANVVTAVVSELTATISLLVFLLMALAITPVVALAVIILGGSLFALFLPVRGMSRRVGKESADATRALYVSFVDVVAASREIKSYGVERHVRDRIDGEIQDLERPMYKSRLLSGLVPAIYLRAVYLIVLGGLAAVYVLDIKDLTAISTALLLVLRAMQQGQLIQVQEQQIAESRTWIGELKNRQDYFRANAVVTGDVELGEVDTLDFENITYRYENGNVALDGVSFSAKRGELIGLIGPSGSGKSTLSEIAVRLDRPAEGTFKVNGRDCWEYSQESWTREVVLVPQLSSLIAASVAENIRFLRDDITREQVEEAGTRSHLEDEIGEMEEGYETMIGERGHRGLSGGQRQRLSIARAVAGRPSLVVLDEPTSALDHKAEEVIVQTIEELREHACVLVIAHRLSTLRHCDRVLVLRDGKREAFCTLDELSDQSEFFRTAGGTGEF